MPSVSTCVLVGAASFSLGLLSTTRLLRACKRLLAFGPRRTPGVPHFTSSPNPSWLHNPGGRSTSPYEQDDVITLLPEEIPKPNLYAFVISAFVPRPIAFVSSISSTGQHNLSPYSYFGCMGHNPPLVSIAICRSPSRGGGKKDTLVNIEETKEFTVAIISSWFVEAANHTCGEYPPDIDEWVLSGLTQEPSTKVSAPRVKEAAVNMECIVRSIQEFEARDGKPSTAVVLGEVVAYHVNKGVTTTSPTGKLVVDPVKLQPVSRLGGVTYGLTNELFDIARPAADGSYPSKR